MARVQGPLFSVDASGSVANTITFAKWKGRNYVRTHAVPSNPNTPGQIANRAMMRFLSQAWASIGGTAQALWEPLASSENVSPFDVYIQNNMRRWTQFSFPWIDPNRTGDTYPELSTPTGEGGVRQATITVPTSTIADGWGVVLMLGTATPVPIAKSNTVWVAPIGDPATTFVITNLTPGTYYARALGFAEDGSNDGWTTTSASFTVT